MPDTSIDQTAFLRQYNLDDSALEEAGISWKDLLQIYNHHLSNIPNLQEVANYIAVRLQRAEHIHSVRVRIKDPEHLLEKIIRKRRQDPKRDIHISNYSEEITDLIGIRALHLFKEDWSLVHEYINTSWSVIGKPIANVREGDSEEYIQQFRNQDCDVDKHPFGYRSVHYLIKSQPTKEVHIAELQVRTIFEEGWSEIDHRTRYPYDLSNSPLRLYLLIFNRLAGMADEMGSFVIMLQNELKSRDTALVEKTNELNKTIQALGLSTAKQKELEKRVAELSAASSRLNYSSLNAQGEIARLERVFGTVGSALAGTVGKDSFARDMEALRVGGTLTEVGSLYKTAEPSGSPRLVTPSPATSPSSSKTNESKKSQASANESSPPSIQEPTSTGE